MPRGLSLVAGREGDFDHGVIDKFAASTKIVRSRTTGEPFAYVAFLEPYATSCANQLSSINSA